MRGISLASDLEPKLVEVLLGRGRTLVAKPIQRCQNISPEVSAAPLALLDGASLFEIDERPLKVDDLPFEEGDPILASLTPSALACSVPVASALVVIALARRESTRRHLFTLRGEPVFPSDQDRVVDERELQREDHARELMAVVTRPMVEGFIGVQVPSPLEPVDHCD